MTVAETTPPDLEKSNVVHTDPVLHTDPESSLERTGEPPRPESTTWKTWIVIFVRIKILSS